MCVLDTRVLLLFPGWLGWYCVVYWCVDRSCVFLYSLLSPTQTWVRHDIPHQRDTDNILVSKYREHVFKMYETNGWNRDLRIAHVTQHVDFFWRIIKPQPDPRLCAQLQTCRRTPWMTCLTTTSPLSNPSLPSNVTRRMLVMSCLGDLRNKLLWIGICRFQCVSNVNINSACRVLNSVVQLTVRPIPKLWRYSLRGGVLICLRCRFDTKDYLEWRWSPELLMSSRQ